MSLAQSVSNAATEAIRAVQLPSALCGLSGFSIRINAAQETGPEKSDAGTNDRCQTSNDYSAQGVVIHGRSLLSIAAAEKSRDE